ncbi:hypothetical protein M1M30_gp160 [Maribacter phage Colly_1]|uniref:Uncharacterized protein n=1 Tax=Maribacter phage Colly_1 TaxID=2745691 RepID=A0A8E4XXU2_9CAUD|nr:hypothetical protein M1M30_gp160 [Maribacter phage Colly_1]QQO97263.1 hypothetical protein Colly1_160 [Maribacter phage Colly_1]
MGNKINAVVVHSKDRPAWNINNTKLGGKFRLAVVPYVKIGLTEESTKHTKDESLKLAKIVASAFNRPTVGDLRKEIYRDMDLSKLPATLRVSLEFKFESLIQYLSDNDVIQP